MASTSSSSSSSSILLSLFELPNPVVINIIQHLTVFDYFRLFGSSISKNQLPSYILNDPLLWSDVDLSQCQLLPYDIYQLFKFYIQQNCSHVQKLAFTLPSTNKVGIDRAECFDFKLFTKLKKIKIFTHDQPYICQDADEDKKTHDENRIEILNNYYLKMICAQCQQLTNIQIYSFDETYNVGELKLECIPQLNSVSFIGYGIYENFQTYDLLKTKLTRLELGRLSMYGIISQIFQSCLLELKSLVYFKCKIDFIDDDDDDDSSVDNLTDFTQFLSKLKYIKEVYIDFYFNVTLPQLSGANKHINLIVFYQKIGEKLYLNSEYYLEENRGEKYVFNRHMLNLKDSKQNVKQYLYKYILCNKYLMTKDELVETTWSDLCWQIQLLKTNVDLQDINALSSITEYKLCYVTNLCLQLCTLTMDTFVHLFSCLINLSHLKMKLLQINEKRQEGYVYDINSEKPTKCRIKQMDIDTVSQSALEYLLYYIHSTLEELIIDKFNQDLFQQFLPYNKLTQLKITNGIDTGCICSIPLLNLQHLTINLTESNCDHISETISKLLDTYSNLIHLTILVELDVILNHLHINHDDGDELLFPFDNEKILQLIYDKRPPRQLGLAKNYAHIYKYWFCAA